MKHRTQDETRRAIRQLLASSGQPLTRTQIAEALGRKKTPFFIGVLEAMVSEGVLLRGVFAHHNGVEGYIYSLRAA